MFGHRYFGARFFAAHYFGEGGSGTPPPQNDNTSRRGGIAGVIGGVLRDPKGGTTEARQ